MSTAQIKQFVQLCETFLPEVSSATGIINGKEGGKEVIKFLHSQKGMAHDQALQEIPKISWSLLKDSYKGAWVVIIGDKGVGAIKATGGTYETVASSGGEVKTFSDSRGGNNIDFLKANIGGLRKFFSGRDTGKVKDVRRQRQDRNAGSEPGKVTQDVLVKKFRPLWTKAITAAIADIKGHIANQIKNDAFEKAKKKLSQIESLQNGLEAIESGSEDIPGFVGSSVQIAVLMTASHYYPEITGEIRKSNYGGGYTSTHAEGPQKLLADISGGDTAKLGTILAFFKRSLISG
jgi:hypothetical protein